MSTLLLSLLIAAAGEPRVIEDPRGFHFTVPEGFEPFPGFQPTASKLYAFGRNLGTPEAITLTVDLLDGPATPGAPSRSCGALMNSIERTVGTPVSETWQAADLSGLRMVMTHLFGEVLVFCVDVPVTPNALSVKISGKPAREAALRETFRAFLASVEGGPARQRDPASPAWVGLVLLTTLVLWFGRRRWLSRAARGR